MNSFFVSKVIELLTSYPPMSQRVSTDFLSVLVKCSGDVLDLVGCASGTMIAFILPSLLSFRIEGYSHMAMLIFLVGGAVGTVGTFFSLKQLWSDIGI